MSPPEYRPYNGMPRLIAEFIRTEAAAGIVMIVFAAAAILAANSPFAGDYKALVSLPISFGWGDGLATAPLKNWVKDILMVLFFLVVGMELKRERREGLLARRDQILLPLAAAAGGMLMPALIFFAFNHGDVGDLNGWAVPSATDIAFAMGILALVGRRTAPAAKMFLLAVAIFDDIGAIIVIAFFYNQSLAAVPLVMALAGLAVLYSFNRRGITAATPYLVMGVYLWFCLYHCGIHTTLAGVAVGLAIPMRDPRHPEHSPLNRCMHSLHGWVSFVVLPIFAFTAAGVSFAGLGLADMLQPLPLGVALGLFLGKQIGLFGVSWVLVRFGPLRKPKGASWREIYGVSVLAGIGFTMSLFIGLLAFDDPERQDLVKIGVTAGSLLSALWGALVLSRPGAGRLSP